MTVTLRPVPPERMPAWIRRSADEYARDLVLAGRSEEEARRVADEGMAESFADGTPATGHAVLDVVDGTGVTVGYLWIGPADGAGPRRVVGVGRRGRRGPSRTGPGSGDHAARRGVRDLWGSRMVFIAPPGSL